MIQKRRIELLAPAKDIETARAALLHGADAIYIGAPRFGARAAAGVSLEDLSILCREAHFYNVRVYVTLNTIIYDDELEEVQSLIWDIYHAGADAIIIQDMGITMMDLPPIPLHSSTQCDTVNPEDAQLLEALGFEQIVLARELNVEQIRQIKAVTTKSLEVFIHGALCVSYSGRCYISQTFTKRSANRGECSQQCRMSYDLRDSRGKLIREQEHLLSPKDLNRSNLIEELLEAGASSFKIEGRLKSVSYVKNITAFYRQCIDEVISKYPDKYERASSGTTTISFSPNPSKSFNRGFTDYQFHLPTPEKPKAHVVNVHSPKSQGEYLGLLGKSNPKSWNIKTSLELSNGDGLLFITPEGNSGGININKSLGDGQVIPARPLQIPQGSKIFRNYDQAWERTMSGKTAQRKLPISIHLEIESSALKLSLARLDCPTIQVNQVLDIILEPAKRFDRERLLSELSKMGDTPFEALDVQLSDDGTEYFIPLSILGQLRRDAVSALIDRCVSKAKPDRSILTPKMKNLNRAILPKRKKFVADYRANISNKLARVHYQAMGYVEPSPAYELQEDNSALLMCTKHCIKHELGYCTRENKGTMPYAEPLYLIQGDNKIRLVFDCAACEMHLIKA